MPAFPPTSALRDVLSRAHRIARRIIVRQTFRDRVAALWAPTSYPWRWNRDFPALYTSFELRVAMAERLVHTPDLTHLVVGRAVARIARTIDLTAPATLHALGLNTTDLTQPTYGFTQLLAARFYLSGITALVVPAAIEEVARIYPRYRVTRGRRASIHLTPSSGTNLVIFPENQASGDGYPEQERFMVDLEGLRA